MAASPSRWRLAAFGAVYAAGFPLPAMRPASKDEPADVRVSLVEPDAIEQVWRPPATVLWSTRLDGHDVVAERDEAGRHRFRLGGLGDCLLSGDGTELLCAAADAGDPVWQRMLLDTVFFCCRLAAGAVALHAAALARDGAAVAVIAGSGRGKTSLAIALTERGWSLLSDDVVFTSSDAHALRAHPGPPLMNVPVALAGDRLGRPLARFEDGGEVWMEVSRHSGEPAVLRRLVFLDRTPGPRLELRPIPPDLMSITANAIYLGSDSEATRSRFEVLADIAARVPALHLRADPSVPPAELAEALEGALA